VYARFKFNAMEKLTMSGFLRISFEIFCKKYLECVCLKNHYEFKIKGSDYIIDI